MGPLRGMENGRILSTAVIGGCGKRKIEGGEWKMEDDGWDSFCPGGCAILLRMNTQLIELAFVLDRSRSISSLADAAIDGDNVTLRLRDDKSPSAAVSVRLQDFERDIDMMRGFFSSMPPKPGHPRLPKTE
jgi:hypothetical protein